VNFIARAIIYGRYLEIANLLYKDIMAKKYPNEVDYHKNIKINREKNTNRVAKKLKEVYLNKLQIASYIDKQGRNEKTEIALDAYDEVEEWLMEQLGVEPDNKFNM
jgi:hypothetical protein